MPSGSRRRGSRKVGLKRIDAAVDALRPLGFSRKLVCKTVKDLLKVYDGDEGWVFIEEASYKLVIETILEKQEIEGDHVTEHSQMQEDACEEGEPALEARGQLDGTCCVGGTNLCCESLGGKEGENGAMTFESCKSVSKIGEVGRQSIDPQAVADMTCAGSHVLVRTGWLGWHGLPLRKGRSWVRSPRTNWGADCVGQLLAPPEVDPHASSQTSKEGCNLEQPNQLIVADRQGLHNEPVHNLIQGEVGGKMKEICGSGPRRAPCYGWISEDEEDDVKNAHGTTICGEQQMVQCAVSYRHEGKRKSRWDVKPSDMF